MSFFKVSRGMYVVFQFEKILIIFSFFVLHIKFLLNS